MSFKVEEVTSDCDADALIPLLWLSYSHPRIPFLSLLFPASSSTPSAIEAQIQLSKAGLMKAHHGNPTSHWIKVTDTSSNKIIAACRWHIRKEDPYTGKPQPEIHLPMWPEGDRRRYAEMSLGSIILPRSRRYTRPHCALEICFTHPEYRGQGAGSLLLKWGTDQADSLGLECFLEATELGMHLYKKHGFVLVRKDEMSTDVEEPSEEWKDMVKRFEPIPWYCMWRPVNWIYDPETMQLPY